jgi:hypothetical protein
MGIPASELEAGVDYPRNRLEFDEFFPDEESCLAYPRGSPLTEWLHLSALWDDLPALAIVSRPARVS